LAIIAWADDTVDEVPSANGLRGVLEPDLVRVVAYECYAMDVSFYLSFCQSLVNQMAILWKCGKKVINVKKIYW
jgi:hypothetical protein